MKKSSEEKEKKPAKSKSKKGKWGKRVLILTPVVLFLAAVLLVWYSFEPLQIPPKVKLEGEDLRNQSQIMQQVMSVMFKKEVPEFYVLKATPAQLNSLLKMASVFRTKKFSLQSCNLHIAPDGVIRFRYGYDTGMRWLHGGILPVSGKVEFRKKGNVLNARFRSLAAGLLPLPESAGKEAFNRFLSRYGSTPEFRFFMECVQSLVFDAERSCFFITVQPKMLRNIL